MTAKVVQVDLELKKWLRPHVSGSYDTNIANYVTVSSFLNFLPTGRNILTECIKSKAFQELQAKMIETKQKIKMADLQIEQLNHTKAHSKLTEAELLKLKPENRMYEGVGRMFIYADMDTVKKRVKERYDKAEDKINTLENSKIFLEKSLKDSENNLREMIQQRKDKDEL